MSHIASILKLAGIADPGARAARIFDLERRLPDRRNASRVVTVS